VDSLSLGDVLNTLVMYKTFKQYCEEFVHHGSKASGAGLGSSVSKASLNGIMQKPSTVTTQMMGDTTGISGANKYLVRNTKTPFQFKIVEDDSGYNIHIRYKKDEDFVPIEQTGFKDKIDNNFSSSDQAVEAIQNLKFRISQVEIIKP